MCCNKGDKFIVKQRDKIVVFLLIIATLFSTISFKAAESECATDELSSLNVPKDGEINYIFYIYILYLIIQNEEKSEELDSINCELMTRIVLSDLSEKERFCLSICGYICCCYLRCCDCSKILKRMKVCTKRVNEEILESSKKQLEEQKEQLKEQLRNMERSMDDLLNLEKYLEKQNLGENIFAIQALIIICKHVYPKLMATRDLVCSRIFDKIRYI